MKLEINDPVATTLVQRLQREIGELYVSNCFLDEHCDAFQKHIIEQNNEILVLNDKLTAYDNKIQELQNIININNNRNTQKEQIQ